MDTASPAASEKSCLVDDYLIYAAGLRRSEVARLRVNDIDSARITISIHQGKGPKDRVVMLSLVLLETLRQYWRYEKPKEWLFPGKTPNQPIGGNTIFAIFHNAVRCAGITKNVSRIRRNRALDFRTVGKAEPEKLPLLWACHRSLRFIYLELELVRDELCCKIRRFLIFLCPEGAGLDPS